MQPPIIEEPVRGVIGDLTGFRLPGLDAMRRAARGAAPAPPIHHLIGLTPAQAGLGSMTFTMPMTGWLEDSVGVVWGGIYALFADAPISTALYTGLPPGKMVSTTELSINYLRPAGPDVDRLVGRAHSVYLGREVGVSEAMVEDGRGRTLAHATTRCVIHDVPFDPDAELAGPEPTIEDPTDPYLRPVPEWARLDMSVWEGERMEVQQKFADGSLPPGPVQHLTGLRFEGIEEGQAGGSFPASPWFSAGAPTMYGGVIAWACDVALIGAVWSTLDRDAVAASLDLQVRFVRPVPLDGERVTVTGRVVHRGRSLRVVQIEAVDARGKTVALGTGSALVIPGGMEQLIAGRRPDEIV